MRYIWEEKDLKFGIYLTPNDDRPFTDKNSLSNISKLGGDGQNFCLINMEDGLVIRFRNKQIILDHLNDGRNNYGFKIVEMNDLMISLLHSEENNND